MMTLEEMLGIIIEVRQNHLLILKHYFEDIDEKGGMNEEWDYEANDYAFDRLQTSLTRLLIGHTYCSNPQCQCSPENRVRQDVERYKKIYEDNLEEDEYEYLINNFS